MGIEEICAEAVAREVKTAMPEILSAISNAIREEARAHLQEKQKTDAPPEVYYSTAQAAEYIHMSATWLSKGRMTKRTEPEEGRNFIPCPKHVTFSSRKVRYAKSELDAWLLKYKEELKPNAEGV